MLISFSRRAFTLVELMIVIAIIGILIVIIGSFNVSGNISQQRVDNWAHEIADMIRDAQQDAVLGKIINESDPDVKRHDITFYIGERSYYSYIVNHVKTSDDMFFKGAVQKQSWSSFRWIDWDKDYSIERIEVSEKHLPFDSTQALEDSDWFSVRRIQIVFNDSQKYVVFSYPEDSSIYPKGTFFNMLGEPINYKKDIASYRITLKYKDFYRYIYGSVYSWNIDIKNQKN